LTASFPVSKQLVPHAKIAVDYSIPKIINGCWQLALDHGLNPLSEKELFRKLTQTVKAGFSCFDCADIYTGVEALLGRFIKQAGLKHRVHVHTKFVPDLADLPSLNKIKIEDTIHRSLSRLGLERLDLVQFHWWDYAVPGFLEAFSVLHEMRLAGKIRLLGLTNFDMPHLVQIMETGIPVASMQLQFSLLDRRPLGGMAELCHHHNISMLCYGVLAGGLLSDRFIGADQPAAENRSIAKYLLVIEEAGGWQVFQSLLGKLATIAEQGQTDIASVAALWVLEQEGVGALILGTGSSNRVEANRHMLDNRLSLDQLKVIETALAGLTVPAGDVFALERKMDGPHAANMKMNLNSGSPQGRSGR